MAHTEIELKLLLATEADYAALRTWLDAHADVSEVRQDNRYLDTADRQLAARRLMLRVRVTDTKVQCTAKAKAQLAGGVMRVQEWQELVANPDAWRAGQAITALGALPEAVVAPLLAGPLAELPGGSEATLHVVGGMQTTRRKCRVPMANLGLAGEGTLLLELDHTLFPAAQERFELEVEHDDAAALQGAITGLLERLEIDWRPAEGSKYEQFLSALASVEMGDED